jgi:hypothetical protein
MTKTTAEAKTEINSRISIMKDVLSAALMSPGELLVPVKKHKLCQCMGAF